MPLRAASDDATAMTAGASIGARTTAVAVEAFAAVAAMVATSPVYVAVARQTHVLGRVSRVRSDSPLSDAEAPVEE